MYMCWCTHGGDAYTRGGQGSMLGFFLNCCSLHLTFLRQSLSPDIDLMDQLDFLASYYDYRCILPCLAFDVGAGESKL